MTYCRNDDCLTDSATGKQWFLIDRPATWDGTQWSVLKMMANNNTLSVKIPAELAPGQVMFRHGKFWLDTPAYRADSAMNRDYRFACMSRILLLVNLLTH